MKKRLLGIFLSALIAISIELPSASASSFLIRFDFDGESPGTDVKSAVFTSEDGSRAEFILGADGTSVTVENEDELVPGNADSNRFLKFDYNGDAGAEIASRLRITPSSPINHDFVLEFDYALNCETGSYADYSPYEGFVDVTLFPNMQDIDTVNMWKYGSKAVTVDQTYRIKTPRTNMIAPEFWSGYNSYATDYAGKSGFATMKLVTRFAEDEYPVYDVYVKMPGENNFTKLVTGKEYATQGYGGVELNASDYNDRGFEYIDLDLLTGRQAASRTSDRVLDAAIDNIRIYEYKQSFFMDFDDQMPDSDVKASTFCADDGTTVEFRNGAEGASVSIRNSDATVPDNPASNRFVKLDYNGNAGSDTASQIRITPPASLKSDFSFEFDFALNRVGDTDGYDAYDRFVDITFLPDMPDSANLWKYGTKAVSIGQDFKVKTPVAPDKAIIPNFWSGFTKYAPEYAPNSGFATMKVITHFNDGAYPVYDVYVKYPGESDFTEIVTGKSFATLGYGNATLTAQDYNDYGFKYIYIELLTGQEAKSRIADNVFDAAIDNLSIQMLGRIKMDPLYSDGMVIPHSCGFQLTGSGADAGSECVATIYTEGGVPVTDTTCAADENGDFALEFSDPSTLSFGEYYYIEVRAGDLSERISNVLCGNVIAFDGARGSSDVSENYTRAFVDGAWYSPGDYSGYHYERTVAGSLSGIITDAENLAVLPANYIVYTVSDQNPDEKTLEDYVKPLISQGKKVIFTGVLKSTSLSDDEVFGLENRLNDLSKKYYGEVLFVPALGGNDDAQRVSEVLSGEKKSFDYWDINVSGNKVYLTLSDAPKSVEKQCFMCEDINGVFYTADTVSVHGKTVEITFENAGSIIRLFYGKNGESTVRSATDNMPLPRFVAEFSAREAYDFLKRYDREKFISLFSSVNANLSGEGETMLLTQKNDSPFGVERENLCYTTDYMEIKLKLQGSKDIRLFADDTVFFEGTVDGEETIVLKREEDQLYVNGEAASEDISVIRDLKIEFSNCSEVELNQLEISMPSYSKILSLLSDIDKLPDAEKATYADETMIRSVYEEYASLGGDGNTYLTTEQKEKMNALKTLLERYESAEKGIRENIVVQADIPSAYRKNATHQRLILSNQNSDVTYSVVCIAAMYSSDGSLVGISAQNVTLAENEKDHTVDLPLDTDGAAGVDIYVLKDIYGGYTVYRALNIPVSR